MTAPAARSRHIEPRSSVSRVGREHLHAAGTA
jgi:hypothetical protein